MSEENKLVSTVLEKAAGIAEIFVSAAGGEWLAARQVAASKIVHSGRRDQELIEVEHKAAMRIKEMVLETVIEEKIRKIINVDNTLVAATEIWKEKNEKDDLNPPEDDWIFRWRSYAENISDSRMQKLWAYILYNGYESKSNRLSLMAMDAFNFFDANSAKVFIAVATRLIFSDRAFDEELFASSLIKSEDDEQSYLSVGRLIDMKLLNSKQNPSNFVQILGITFNIMESVYNTSDTYSTISLSQTGRELAAALIPKWNEKENYYRNISQSKDVNKMEFFEAEDEKEILGYVDEICSVMARRLKTKDYWMYIRNRRDDYKSLYSWELENTAPYNVKIDDNIDENSRLLSRAENMILARFRQNLGQFEA